jgi:hypothetical protein
VNLAAEWISAFSQADSNGNSFRITGIVDPATALRQQVLPTSLPQVPLPTQPGTAAAAATGATPAPAATPQGLIPSAVQMLLGLPTR